MTNPIEQLSVKAMGTVNAVKAGFNGLRGVFLHLAEEHGELVSLMKRVKNSNEAQHRREQWPHIRAELLSHERAEQAEVYALLGEQELTRELTLVHHREAGQLEVAVLAVDAQEPASAAWLAAYEHLFALVEQHIREEEDEWFPRAQLLIEEPQAKAVLPRYEAAKHAARRAL